MSVCLCVWVFFGVCVYVCLCVWVFFCRCVYVNVQCMSVQCMCVCDVCVYVYAFFGGNNSDREFASSGLKSLKTQRQPYVEVG